MAIVVQGPTPRTDALDATAGNDVPWSRKGPEYRKLARLLECELAGERAHWSEERHWYVTELAALRAALAQGELHRCQICANYHNRGERCPSEQPAQGEKP